MCDPLASVALRATLTFDQRCKSRLLITLENGESAAVITERGRVLHDGESVKLPDGRTVQITAAPESLLEATCADPVLLAKAAYHLGNRHVAVQLMHERLRFAADHVLQAMVSALGLEVRPVEAAFEPECGAYGQHHGHGSETPPYQPKIHSFSSP